MKALSVAVLSLFIGSTSLLGQEAQHPLDPLTWQEHWTVLEVLHESDRLDGDTRFSIVNLREPAKEVVLEWDSGEPVPRTAYALVRQNAQTFEALIDLVGRRVVSWTEVQGGEPNWLGEEYVSVNEIVKKNPDFVEALRRRGIEDMIFIDCIGIPPGYYGTDEQNGRRIAHVYCEDARGVRNTWTRQIEGLTAVVDVRAGEVLRIVDEGVVPIPTVTADYDAASLGPARDVPSPIRIEQPLGPGFVRNGYEFEWQNWRFHVRPDHRVGTVLSLVSYHDGDRPRSVLYQGHLSEIFVPYMDPSFAWYTRNFLDAGEFTAGGLTKPLMRGLDCPDHSVYLDGLFVQDNGRPEVVPDVICLFERESGDVAWRHWSGHGNSESRAKRDLVVRSAAVLGNYDYIFDWVFRQDGAIQVAVGATGIAEVKMVAERGALADATFHGSNGSNGSHGEADDAKPQPDAYGRFVDPQIVAVNHDHYFSFRLDLDVDGPTNSLHVDRMVTERLPDAHPRRSVWVGRPSIARTEADAKLNIDLSRPTMWRVVSTNRTNHVGYPTSYELMPGKNAATLLSEDDYPRRRAGFIDHHLWATPYAADELYAAGDFPTLSTPGKGLPEWTSSNRTIDQTDIVLWHTIGMHHMVRAEDWPVMPVMWHSFELRPFDFFNRNPAMDLPE